MTHPPAGPSTPPPPPGPKLRLVGERGPELYTFTGRERYEGTLGPIDNPLPRPTPPPKPKLSYPPGHPQPPEPGPGQPPQPPPRGYVSRPFGQTGGRYGYAMPVMSLIAAVSVWGFGAALVGAWLA